MAASATFSGARAIFLINSIPVAYAGGVSYEEMIDYEPVDVLANLAVQEFVPVAYRTSLNAQIFRVVGGSLKAAGIMPRLENIIQSDDLTAAIQDTVTRETIALFLGVRSSGVSADISARGIVSQNVSFVAIKVQDESEVA